MPIEGPDTRSGPMTLMRKNGAFRLLIAGSSVSVLGSRVTTIAYPLLVLYLTSSPATAGCVAFAATAPSLMAYMLVGALVDRRDPRRTMLISESGRGITIAMVAVTLLWLRPGVTLLITAVVVEEILKTFSILAEPRYVCSLVEGDDAKKAALASMEGRTHVAVLIGRPLGAFLFEVKPILPFLFDSASFLFSISTLIFIKDGEKDRRKTVIALRESPSTFNRKAIRTNNFTRPYRWPDMHLLRDIREVISWLRNDRRAKVMIILSASATLISQALIMIFLAAASWRHLSSAMIGMILAASGIGGTLGAMVGSRLKAILAASRLEKSVFAPWLKAIVGRPLIQIQLWVWTAAFTVLCVSGEKSLFPMAAVMTVLGFTGALSNIQLNTYLMTSVPKAMLARVTSVGNFLSLAACAVGPAIGGILIQNYKTAFALNSLLCATLAVAIISLVPSMRSSRTGSKTSDNIALASAGLPFSCDIETAEYLGIQRSRINIASPSDPGEISFLAVAHVASGRGMSLAALRARHNETTIILATVGRAGKHVTGPESNRPNRNLLAGKAAFALQAYPMLSLLLSLWPDMPLHLYEVIGNVVRYGQHNVIRLAAGAECQPIAETWFFGRAAPDGFAVRVSASREGSAPGNQRNVIAIEPPMFGAVCTYRQGWLGEPGREISGPFAGCELRQQDDTGAVRARSCSGTVPATAHSLDIPISFFGKQLIRTFLAEFDSPHSAARDQDRKFTIPETAEAAFKGWPMWRGNAYWPAGPGQSGYQEPDSRQYNLVSCRTAESLRLQFHEPEGQREAAKLGELIGGDPHRFGEQPELVTAERVQQRAAVVGAHVAGHVGEHPEADADGQDWHVPRRDRAPALPDHR